MWRAAMWGCVKGVSTGPGEEPLGSGGGGRATAGSHCFATASRRRESTPSPGRCLAYAVPMVEVVAPPPSLCAERQGRRDRPRRATLRGPTGQCVMG